MKPTGAFEIPAGSTADVAVTGLGFRPSCIQFYASDHGTQGKSLGSDDAAVALATRVTVVGGTSNYERDGHSIYTMGVRAAIKSFDPDGFTVAVASNTCGTVTVVHFRAD